MFDVEMRGGGVVGGGIVGGVGSQSSTLTISLVTITPSPPLHSVVATVGGTVSMTFVHVITSVDPINSSFKSDRITSSLMALLITLPEPESGTGSCVDVGSVTDVITVVTVVVLPNDGDASIIEVVIDVDDGC